MQSQHFGRRVSKTVATPWKQAGGGPAASHFSCFAKKSNQKKATAKPLPSRWSGSQMRQLAFGRKDKLAALKHVFPLFPNASRLIWQRLNAGHVNSNGNVKPSALRGLLGRDGDTV